MTLQQKLANKIYELLSTREIKFRVWDYRDSRMIVNENHTYPAISLDGSIIAYNGDEHRYDLENIILMQFTGLLDKHGKEIYEGDIIKIPEDYEEYGFMAGEQREVYYLDGCFRLKPRKDNTRDRGNTIMDDMDKCEVIGNIYENKDLLSNI